MKKILLACVTAFIMSCSTSSNNRQLSSLSVDISGTILGYVNYGILKKAPAKRAVRIYLSRESKDSENYNAVILEYTNLNIMAPKYIAADKLPAASPLVGDLKHIAKRISIYKVIPTEKIWKYEMQRMKVVGDKIEASNDPNPSFLHLGENRKSPLDGAKITKSKNGEGVEIKFPKNKSGLLDIPKYGPQYKLAKFTYERFKLGSTWRKEFLNGPYLSAYAVLDDVVLDLETKSKKPFATFKLNPAKSNLSKSVRENHFTNKKSAFIEGRYKVNEPQDGMFTFVSSKDTQKVNPHVAGRVGLFIDIFDATKSRNQDVVELVLIDPENPEDFLMYFEHPENGDGK